METSPLTAQVCGGGCQPAEQVSHQHDFKHLCFQSGIPFVLSLTLKYTSFFVAFLVIPFLLSASSLISGAHNVALFLYSVSSQSYSPRLGADACL